MANGNCPEFMTLGISEGPCCVRLRDGTREFEQKSRLINVGPQLCRTWKPSLKESRDPVTTFRDVRGCAVSDCPPLTLGLYLE